MKQEINKEYFTGGEWKVGHVSQNRINGQWSAVIFSLWIPERESKVGSAYGTTKIIAEANAELITDAPKMKRYIDYVEAKIQCNEVPIPFKNWLTTPASKPIHS